MLNQGLVVRAALGAGLLALASCQSGSSGGTAQSPSVAAGSAVAEAPLAAEEAGQGQTAEIKTEAGPATGAVLALTDPGPDSSGSPAACAITLAGGPPQKPVRGADFGSAVVKNAGKNVQRSLIQQVAGHFGGGIGAVVGGAVAQSAIRPEEDIKGTWTITDGSSNCACTIKVDGLFKIEGRGKDTGSLAPQGCANPSIAQAAHWALGYSFTGYDASFDLKAKDNRTVLASLKRDGIHYFSGTAADGTPVVMWRDGQNYMQMKAN